MTAWLADILAVSLIVSGIKNGARKGLIRSVWRIAEWILTIILVFALSKPAVTILSGGRLYTNIYSAINTAITEKTAELDVSAATGGNEFYEKISDVFGIPAMLVPYALPDFNSDSVSEGVQGALNMGADRVSGTAAMLIIKIIANVMLLIVIRILLWAVFRLLNVVSKLPGLKQANGFLGSILGFVNIMLIVYLILAALYLIASANEEVYKIINETLLVKYLYDNNILLKLFIKI